MITENSITETTYVKSMYSINFFHVQVLEIQNFIKFFKAPKECDNFFFITIMMKMKVVHIYFNRHLRSKMRVVGRGVLTPLFYEDPPALLTPLVNFLQMPPSHPYHLQYPLPLLFPLSFIFGWMGDRTTLDVLFYLTILWIYTCWALASYVTRHQMHWGLTHNANFCWCSDLISHTKTHTNRHTQRHTTQSGSSK